MTGVQTCALPICIGAVGQIFKVGSEYVVFGFGSPLVADGCNSTKLTKESETTLKWLAKKPSRLNGRVDR